MRGAGPEPPPRPAGPAAGAEPAAFRFPSAQEEAGAAAAMQVSSLNEVKIYSLSAGRSLPEVSGGGRPRAGGRAAGPAPSLLVPVPVPGPPGGARGGLRRNACWRLRA